MTICVSDFTKWLIFLQNLLAKELLEHQEKSAFRNGQLDLVCKQLDEKSKLCDCLAESNQRLTLKLNEEREKNTELDKKLENEKRAAAKVYQVQINV